MFDYDEKPELNITPLVDIMLVLLAILMVATPAIIYEEKIQLPDSSKTQVLKDRERKIIRVELDKKIHIDQNTMSFGEFADNVILLVNSGKLNKDEYISIRADKNLLYGDVMFILTTLRQAGLSKLSLDTMSK